ncbi:unnamed protein product [Rotaria magnacalcarata]|uniref:PLAT domain-containing protein n=1 Tax=Rotaria magnacalcarata TaxID=392030 RepID=A0A815NQR6_9BILA|nr:unnamed protein product [Rotaria magnacalcarata]
MLKCRLSEASLGCSITIEYEKIEWQEGFQCSIRFHGQHCLSPIFFIEMARDGRMQMNFVYKDVGEIMAIEIELLSNKEIGLYIKWIEINIPRKSFLQRFDVQRWLHLNMIDGRTRLMLTPNQLPGYAPKRIALAAFSVKFSVSIGMLENIEQPKRDNVKYMVLIEISQTKGNIDGSTVSIGLVGNYGRASANRINMKYNTIMPLKNYPHRNIFELTMLDVGLLHEYQISVENDHNNGSLFITTMYIYRKQYYEVNVQQWIENGQILNGYVRSFDLSATSTLFNEVQSKSSFILWITGSDLIKKEITLPIEFQLNCQNTMMNPVQETITIRANIPSVSALSTACTMPLKSILLGYNRTSSDYCLASEIVALNVFQGQHFYFQYDNEVPKSMKDIDYYSFTLKENVLTSISHNSKQYIVSILTSENNQSEKHTIKLVLRGERGLTTMLSLHNSSWNKTPFRAKHKDKFLLLASDIGQIIGLTIFHASEEGKFNFDIMEIFVPETKSCIRLNGKYQIFNEIIDFNCQSHSVYLVQIKSGFSTLNETANVVLTLLGEESSVDWILLTCDNDTQPFRTGQLDTFYIPTKRLGKIRAANINCSNIDANSKWFCEMIYVHDTVFNIKSNYVINRWFGDHHESDLVDTLNATSKAALIQPASTRLLTTFLMLIKNGLRTTTNPMLIPSLYVFFAGQYGSSPIIHLNELTDRNDIFQSLETDEFTFTIPDTGMPDIMRIWNTDDLAPWTFEYIDIKNITNSKTAHFPMGGDLPKVDSLFSSYIDLEVDIGRVILPLPGPRSDAAYPSYQLISRTNQARDTNDSVVTIQIKSDKHQSKWIPLIGLFNNETTSKLYLYGICPLGELKEISIYFDGNHKNAQWICEYVMIYDYLNNQYYGAKINTSVTSNPIYRILYKTQANVLTNITRDAEISIRLIGDESTSFFRLDHNRPLISGSVEESFYQGNESITGLNKLEIQLFDNENTHWACESIEIQNLLTDEIVVFPINDILEATIKTDVANQKITTWKSGFKSGIIYIIRVRTGYQGASLNFRFGSVYLSLKLYGDSGVSNEIPLRIPFEQLYYLKCNQTDTFEIGQIISIVGQISSIDINHNGKREDFWHINWIDIIDITTNKSYHFTIEKYLNKDLGTNFKVLHIPADVSMSATADELESIPNYAIRVQTGTQTPAHIEDTDELSTVSIVLIDPINDSARIPLKRVNSTVRSIFQPGQEDRFDITMTPMLDLKVLQIYFNGTFPWFCARLTITDRISGLSYRFDVEQWLTENTLDNPVNVFGQREDDLGWMYSVTIKTQAVLPAKTNLRGKILLSIYGEQGSLNDAILGSGRLMHGLFHAGGEDTIELKSSKRLGEIHSIELRLDVAEWQSWLCDMIEIVDSTANWDFLSRTMITKTYKFPINRWLGAHAMDKRNSIRTLINQEPGYAKMPSYIIHILTGTKNISNDSDIPTNVYLQLFCSISNNVYGPILLDKSSNNTQAFRKGQIDEFYINDLSYCGEINKIRLWHDGGKVTSWHCEWIKITNVEKNELYEFSVEKILDEDLEEGSSNLILYSEKKDEISESELATPRSIIS